MKYISYCKILETIKDFNLTSFINLNQEKILFISKSYNIFFKFDDLKSYLKEEELNKLKFFEVKDHVVLENSKPLKFKNLNLDLEYIYRNFKAYNSETSQINNLNQDIKKLKKTFKILDKLSIDFYKENIICFDIEAYEDNQNKILEIGWATIKNKNLNVKHYIVEENIELRNGKFVEDNKDNFLFGKSIVLPQKEIVEILKKELDESKIIIGQGISNDFNYLLKINNEIQIKNYEHKILDNSNNLNKLINKDGCSIKKACEFFNINVKNLHNAGNDAFYNLKIIDSIIIEYKDKFKEMYEVLNNKLKLKKDSFSNKWENIKNKNISFNDEFSSL